MNKKRKTLAGVFESVDMSQVESKTPGELRKSVNSEKKLNRFLSGLSDKQAKKLPRNMRRSRRNIRGVRGGGGVLVIRSYKRYMLSKLWVQRKNQYWQRYGKRCAACGHKNYVTLHHMVYNNNYGQEPDDEVIALCREHHAMFHQQHKLSKNMRKETLLFVEKIKSSI